jgi:hypothetical protein
MKQKRSQGRSLKAQSEAAVRASITFPPDLYETLEEIAKQKKGSSAWVVRDECRDCPVGECPRWQ